MLFLLLGFGFFRLGFYHQGRQILFFRRIIRPGVYVGILIFAGLDFLFLRSSRGGGRSGAGRWCRWRPLGPEDPFRMHLGDVFGRNRLGAGRDSLGSRRRLEFRRRRRGFYRSQTLGRPAFHISHPLFRKLYELGDEVVQSFGIGVKGQGRFLGLYRDEFGIKACFLAKSGETAQNYVIRSQFLADLPGQGLV